MKFKLRLLILSILGLLFWYGCATNGQIVNENEQVNKTDPTPTTETVSYSTNLDELKKEFNADKGKVRLVTLLSPT